MLNRRILIKLVLALIFVSSMPVEAVSAKAVPAGVGFFKNNKGKSVFNRIVDAAVVAAVFGCIAYLVYRDVNRPHFGGGGFGGGRWRPNYPVRRNQAVHTRFKLLAEPAAVPVQEPVAPVNNKKPDVNFVDKKAGENEGNCQLCYDKIEIGKDLVVLPCGHKYHKDCAVNNKITECGACELEKDESVDASQKCGLCGEGKQNRHKMSCCGMEFCRDCLMNEGGAIRTAIKEKNINNLKCPNVNCKVVADKPERNKMARQDLEGLLDAHDLKVVDNLLEKKADSIDPGCKDCPGKDCKAYYIMGKDRQGNNIVERVNCPHCNSNYCTDCRMDHSYETTCEEARLERERVANLNGNDKERLTQQLMDNFRKCPGCKTPVEKTYGCRAMDCPLCKTEFCYDCGQMAPGHTYGHRCPAARPGHELDLFDNMFNEQANRNQIGNI